MDETEVIERVRAVYVDHHARLWRSLVAFSGSQVVADEAAAEAFVQVLRRGADVRDVAAWVWRAAFAIARGQLQERRHEPLPVDRYELPDESLRDVLASLEPLSERDRETLVLCHVGGWTPAELAPVLGVSASTLRVRLHRATRRARRLLSEGADG